MIEYMIAGQFPSDWEDLIPVDKSYPRITIIVENIPERKIHRPHKGWIDVDIPESEGPLTTYICSKIIAELLKVAETDIHITQLG